MDRGAWQATVPGVLRIRHNLATKPQQHKEKKSETINTFITEEDILSLFTWLVNKSDPQLCDETLCLYSRPAYSTNAIESMFWNKSWYKIYRKTMDNFFQTQR